MLGVDLSLWYSRKDYPGWKKQIHPASQWSRVFEIYHLKDREGVML
jgi:hypothetical protein